MPEAVTLSREDRLLFRRNFEYETKYSMRDCARLLNTLNQPHNQRYDHLSLTANVYPQDKQITFHVSRRSMGLTAVEAIGEVNENADGKRLVRGYVKIVPSYLLFVILLLSSFLPQIIVLAGLQYILCVVALSVIVAIFNVLLLIHEHRKFYRRMLDVLG